MRKSRKRSRRKGWRKKPWTDPLALDRMFDRVVHDRGGVAAPPFVYHYTTWEGTEGILSSQRFWAAAHDCTNDEAELVSADSIIIEVAEDLRRSATGTAAKVLDSFLDEYPKRQITKLMRVCLACFSLARDDESQWRRYGDDGRGVCMGIRVLNEPPPKNPPAALVIVDYSESSWRDTVRGKFEEICSVLSRAEGSLLNCRLGVSALNRIAAFASMTAKRSKWAGEQEVRHVTLVPHNSDIQLKERESLGQVKWYLPIPVRADGKRIALSEVIIGPNRNAEDTREQLKTLLADSGYRIDDMEYPKITVSEIPSWDPSAGGSALP
jgi:hypothetical protein